MKKILFLLLCHSTVFAQKINFDNFMVGYTIQSGNVFFPQEPRRVLHSVTATYFFSSHYGLNIRYGRTNLKSDSLSVSIEKTGIGLKIMSSGLFQNRVFLQGGISVNNIRVPSTFSGIIAIRNPFIFGVNTGLLLRPFKRMVIDITFFTIAPEESFFRPELGINYIFYKNKNK